MAVLNNQMVIPNLMVLGHVHRLLHRVCKADGMAHRAGLGCLGAVGHHRRWRMGSPLENHTDHNAAKDPDNSDMFFDMWWVHIHIDMSSYFKVHTKTWHQHSHIVWHLLWQGSCHISSEIFFAMYSDICSSKFCVIFILWQQLSLVVWHLIWQTSCDI